MILPIAVFLIVLIAYAYTSLQLRIRQTKGIPGFRQISAVGNPLVLFGFLKVPWDRESSWSYKWENLYQIFKKDIMVVLSPFSTNFFLADADLIHEVCVSRREHFPKPTFVYEVLRIFGDNVVTTEDDEWKRHRKIATIGFSERNNKMVHRETLKYTLTMLRDWQKQKDGKGESSVEAASYMLKLALCVISSAAFGFEVSWENEEKVEPGYDMTFFSALEEISSRPIEVSVLPRWMLHLPFWGLKKLGIAMRDFRKYIDKSIEVGKQDMNAEKDGDDRKGSLFSSLIKAAFTEREGKEPVLNDDELRGNIYIMLVAGHGTLSLISLSRLIQLKKPPLIRLLSPWDFSP